MDLHVLDLGTIDVAVDKELRPLPHSGDDLDQCLWNAGKWLRERFGVDDGFISFHLPLLTGLIFREYSFEKAQEWCSIRIPPSSQGRKDACLKQDERRLLEIMKISAIDAKRARKEMRRAGLKTRHLVGVVFLSQNETVGFISLKMKKIWRAKTTELLLGGVSALFRRACEKLNARMLRQIAEVKTFEHDECDVDDLEDLIKVSFGRAMKIVNAGSGTFMEMNHLEGDVEFTVLSNEWKSWCHNVSPDFLVPYKAIARDVALKQTSRIVGDRHSQLGYSFGPQIDAKITSMMQVPVIFQGITLAVIVLEHASQDHFFYPDLVAVELLAGIVAPYLQDFRRIASDYRVERAFRGIFRAPTRWSEIIEGLVADAGVDFASIQLIYPEQGYIETVATSEKIPEAWANTARHLLCEKDIQVDVANISDGPKLEVVAGWDDRFDPVIYDHFGHDRFLRVWFPILVVRNKFDTFEAVALELGSHEVSEEAPEGDLHDVFRLEGSLDSVSSLICLGTIEVGFVDRSKHVPNFGKVAIESILKASYGFVQRLLTLLPESVLDAISKELLLSSGAGSVSLHFGTEPGKQGFSVSFGAINRTTKLKTLTSQFAKKVVWRLAVSLLESEMLENAGQKIDREPKIFSKEQEIQSNWSELWEAGVRSLAAYPLVKGILLICWDHEHRPSHYEQSVFNSGAIEARRLIRYLYRELRIKSRQFLLHSFENLGVWLEQVRNIDSYRKEVCKVVARGLLANEVSLYVFDLDRGAFILAARHLRSETDADAVYLAEVADLTKIFPFHLGPLDVTTVDADQADGWLGRVIIGGNVPGESKLEAVHPCCVIYVHIREISFEESTVLEWLKTPCGVALRHHLLAYEAVRRNECQMRALRSLGEVDSAQGSEAVLRQAVRAVSSLPGYRGCAFFFEDRENGLLIMEHHDDTTGMLSPEKSPKLLLTQRKVSWTRILAEIKNDSGETMTEVALLAGKDLTQKAVKDLPFQQGAKLVVVRPWPCVEEGDESTDLYQLVLFFDEHLHLSEEEARFIGNLGIHLHMGIKQAREWTQLKLGGHLERWLVDTPSIEDFSEKCVTELVDYLPGSIHLVYVLKRSFVVEEPAVFELAAWSPHLRDDDLGAVREISKEKHRYLWDVIRKGDPLRKLPGHVPSFVRPWAPLVGGNISSMLAVPFNEPVNMEPLGCILCLCTPRETEEVPAYTPFHKAIGEVTGRNMAVGISQKRREEEFALDAANLGHAVKVPLHGILGYTEMAMLALKGGKVKDVQSCLETVTDLVQRADEQILVSLGKPGTEAIASLGQIVKTVVGSFKVAAKKHRVRIEIDHSLFKMPQVKINAPKLEMVLVALLDNAIKYSNPKREVRLRAMQLKHGFRFEMSNFGARIVEKDGERIYEPGQRGLKRRRGRYVRSSGLGLPAARRISDELGIKIHHKSTYRGWGNAGEGQSYHTRFFLDFPESLLETNSDLHN